MSSDDGKKGPKGPRKSGGRGKPGGPGGSKAGARSVAKRGGPAGTLFRQDGPARQTASTGQEAPSRKDAPQRERTGAPAPRGRTFARSRTASDAGYGSEARRAAEPASDERAGGGHRRAAATRSASEGRSARPVRDERSRRDERPNREERTAREERPNLDSLPEREKRARITPPTSARRGAEVSAPLRPTKAEQKAATTETLATGVQTVIVSADEADMRVDRFLESRFPVLSFSHIQRIVRKGELRVDGKRAETKDRLVAGQSVRIPPLKIEERPAPVRSPAKEAGDAAYIKSLVLYEDADIMVLNKPMGLAVQGGSGTVRHVDGMLDALRDRDGQKPRLVHRLDKDTAGCLVVAKTRFAAATLAKSFRSRSTRKIYWALVAAVPRVKQGRVSTYLAKEEADDGDSRMAVANHGDEGATHALTYYAVVDTAAQKLAWLSLKPVTGRTHQLRAHAAHIGHPIVGDPKYFNVENWELPGGIQNKLHLLARRIVVPHPRTGKPVDVTAPLPPHMRQSWNLLGFETDRYDPIVDAPDA